jgi:hypothetical protein
MGEILEMKKCGNCGNEFSQKSNSQKYCSDKCGKVARDQKYGKNLVKTLTCNFCGKAFVSGTFRKVYCNEECRKRAKAKRISKPEMMKFCMICKTEVSCYWQTKKQCLL